MPIQPDGTITAAPFFDGPRWTTRYLVEVNYTQSRIDALRMHALIQSLLDDTLNELERQAPPLANMDIKTTSHDEPLAYTPASASVEYQEPPAAPGGGGAEGGSVAEGEPVVTTFESQVESILTAAGSDGDKIDRIAALIWPEVTEGGSPELEQAADEIIDSSRRALDYLRDH